MKPPPLYAELDAFISMIKRRGGNEGLPLHLAGHLPRAG